MNPHETQNNNTILDQNINLFHENHLPIYIYKKMRNSDKCITYLQNFHLDINNHHLFLFHIKKVISTSVSYKINKNIDKHNKIYIFNGDYQNIIKEILMDVYHIDENRIKFVG
jgi:hypothetical protein